MLIKVDATHKSYVIMMEPHAHKQSNECLRMSDCLVSFKEMHSII